MFHEMGGDKSIKSRPRNYKVGGARYFPKRTSHLLVLSQLCPTILMIRGVRMVAIVESGPMVYYYYYFF